jgi:hypothetical protein
MSPANWCSRLLTNAWLFPSAFNDYEGERNWVGTIRSVSQCAGDVVKSPFFLRSSGSVQLYWWLHEILSHMRTVRRKRTSDVHGLAYEAYVSCVSNFSWRVVGVFYTGKIQDGQDRALQFWDGLVNNEAHSDLSWFRSLLKGNSPTCNSLILKMKMCYKRWVESSRSSCGEGRNRSPTTYLKGRESFIDYSEVC